MPSLKESFLAFLAINQNKETEESKPIEDIFTFPMQEEDV